MDPLEPIRIRDALVSRRWLLKVGAAGAAGGLIARAASAEPPPELAGAIAGIESLVTPADQFRDVSRGKPIPHTIPPDRLAELGLTRETWRLAVGSDPDYPARLRNTLEGESAFDFAALMRLAETRAVRFAKVMTCLNIGCPLGFGIWEGVPLRDVFWLTEPREDVRRVIYCGYHNDDPAQMFKSSLPVGRVLEDPFDLPPVILCYKLNGEWLSSPRGGPVRLVVPEAYGFKSIKWLTHVWLSNLAHANDTYADGNNDVDSPLKTFAATLSVPTEIPAGQSIAVTGYAQVGISGLRAVQALITPRGEVDEGDSDFTMGAWRDAQILPPPTDWGGGLAKGRIPEETLGFDSLGQPQSWPMRLGKVHWGIVWPGLPAGEYVFRCRTIDEKGVAQPMPRPFRKSGHCAIEAVDLKVT